MGIIQRQAFKHSMVSYFAAGIGMLATLYIYPLDKEIYGLAQWFINTAIFLVPFTSMGITSLTVKFFPEFRDEQTHNRGFLLKLILFSGLAFALFVALVYIFRSPIVGFLDRLDFDVRQITAYKYPLLLLTGLTLYNTLFPLYISNYNRIVIPAIFKNLFAKIALPILVFLSYRSVLDTPSFVWAWVGVHAIILLLLVIYTISLGAFDFRPQFKFLTSRLVKSMSSYAIYSSLSGMGSVVTVRIDIIMLGLLLTMEDTGIYAISLFIANIIEIPTRAILQIASPILSKAWNEKDMQEIEMIYRKSSLNLLLPGVLMFLLVWISVDDLFLITGKHDELVAGIMVVFFLGLAKLIDMATSVNSQIILYSDYYRYHLWFLLITAVFNVILNYILISNMGIVGAAIGTAFSIAIFNILKYLFLLWKMRIQPFDMATVKVIALGLIVFAGSQFFPSFSNPYLAIIVQSGIVTGLYILLAKWWKISPDFEEFVFNIFKKKKQIKG